MLRARVVLREGGATQQEGAGLSDVTVADMVALGLVDDVAGLDGGAGQMIFLDRRVRDGTMIARGDNCKGLDPRGRNATD